MSNMISVLQYGLQAKKVLSMSYTYLDALYSLTQLLYFLGRPWYIDMIRLLRIECLYNW